MISRTIELQEDSQATRILMVGAFSFINEEWVQTRIDALNDHKKKSRKNMKRS